MSIPDGMWECPVCGDYVDKIQRECPNCAKKKSNAPRRERKRIPLMASDNSEEKYILKPSFSNEKSWASSFFRIHAWITWIVGLIASIMLANVEKTSSYSYRTYTEFDWSLFFTYCSAFYISGGLLMCASELFENIQSITNSLKEMTIEKKK